MTNIIIFPSKEERELKEIEALKPSKAKDWLIDNYSLLDEAFGPCPNWTTEILEQFKDD